MTQADGSTAEELPLLGEPFAVELANTWYLAGETVIDFLSDELVRPWLSHAAPAHGLEPPGRLSSSLVASLRRTRDAARLLLEEAADRQHTAEGRRAAATLQREARTAAAHLALELTDERLAWRLRYSGSAHDAFVADVAGRCILFLGGSKLANVRRCARPGCSMLFVQAHLSRRYCHESCAHRVRQARYYRATRQRRSTSAARAGGGSSGGRHR